MAKVMISLPDELLAALDAAARSRSATRSGLIRDAVRIYMAQGSGGDRRAAIKRLQKTFAPLQGSPEELVRADRAR